MITPSQVLALAAWPPCPLHLPEQVSLGGHGTITDVAGYISTNVTRLNVPSQILNRRSRQALDLLIEKLETT